MSELDHKHIKGLEKLGKKNRYYADPAHLYRMR